MDLGLRGRTAFVAALPAPRRSDAASILFLSSTCVKQPLDGLPLSNSLRGAVNGMARSLSRELTPEVRVNSILTGRIRTGRTSLARVAVFLSSHAAAYVTGVALAVDGGVIQSSL